MKKKFLAVLLLAVLLAMSMAQVAWANVYGKWQTIGGVTTVRCTYYAWEQVYSKHGISLPNWGNGGSWLAGAQRDGYATGTVPRAGSIAVWTSGLGIPSGYGHVAYVTAVRSNGKIVCNEGGITPTDKNSNVVSEDGIYNGHVIPNDYRGMPQGYIYLDKVPEPAPKPVDPLHWSDIGNGFYAYIYNPASGLYVENVNQNAQLGSKKEGELGQLWYFIAQNDGSYNIINMADGQCLNFAGGKYAAQTNINLVPEPSNDSISHKWYVCGSQKKCYITPINGSQDFVMDIYAGIDGNPLEGRNIWLWNNRYKAGEGFSDAQTFQIIKVDAKNIPTNLGDDFYATISYNGKKVSYLASNDVLQTSNNLKYMDVKTTQTYNNNDTKQIWHFVRNSSGYYNITNEYNSWRLTIKDAVAESGQQVVAWAGSKNTLAQRWYIMGVLNGGKYHLASSVNFPWRPGFNMFSLNIPTKTVGAAVANGTNTNIALYNGNANQTFSINKINYTKPAQPATPTGFTVSYDSNGITCKWKAVPVADKWDARYYQLALYKVAADGTETRLDTAQVGDVTSYTRAGALEPGNYIISIQALNKRYRSWASGIVQKKFTIYNNYTVSVGAQAGGSAKGGGTYREGLPVTLTATPGGGYQFAGWQDVANGQIVSTEAVYTFTANANRSLTACFSEIPEPVIPAYRVTVSASVGGSANGGGTYKQREMVALQAVADEGYKFVGWQEAGRTDFVSQEANYSFEATADRALTALFELLPVTDPDQPTPSAPAVKYSVRLSAEPAEGGTVRGGGIYNQGDSLTVRAEANNGWKFANWQAEGRIVSSQSVYSLRADADVQLKAVFQTEQEKEEDRVCAVALSHNVGGTVSGAGIYILGEKVTVKAMPDAGQRFVAWVKQEDINQVLSTAQEYSFEAAADCILHAIFESVDNSDEKVHYAVRPSTNTEAGGTVEGSGIFEADAQVTVKAIPVNGYLFMGWQDLTDGSLVSTEAVFSFKIAENKELMAVFSNAQEEPGNNPGGNTGGSSGGGGSHRPVTKPAAGTESTETKPGAETNQPGGDKAAAAGEIAGVFGDVQNNAWYSEAIAYVYNNGLMKGTEKGFEPNADTTRAMIVTMLHRLEKEPAANGGGFGDVAGGQWYSEAVAWAAANGVVKGYNELEFAPEDYITREQLAAILFRYAQFKGLDASARGDLSGFADSAAVADWAEEAVQWAVGAGLLNGDEGRLRPADKASRAEVAMLLMRFAESVK